MQGLELVSLTTNLPGHIVPAWAQPGDWWLLRDWCGTSFGPCYQLDIYVRGIHKERNSCVQSFVSWKECRREEQTSPRLVVALEMHAGLREPAQASQSRSVPKSRDHTPTRIWHCALPNETNGKTWCFRFIITETAIQHISRNGLSLSMRDTVCLQIWTTTLFSSDELSVFLKALQLYHSPVPGVTPHPLKWMTRTAHTIPAEISAQICTVNSTLHRIYHSMSPFQFLVFPLLNISSSIFASWWASHFHHHHLIEKIAPVIPPYQLGLSYLQQAAFLNDAWKGLR